VHIADERKPHDAARGVIGVGLSADAARAL
jgi:hypothetical protein